MPAVPREQRGPEASSRSSSRTSRPLRPSSSALPPVVVGVPAVVVFDNETTGLDRSARLVEIAAIRYHDGVEFDRFVTLVDPGVRIPYEATAVHGITDRMVKGSPKAAEVLKRFHEVIDGAVLVAHYAAFDLRIVNAELERVRLPLLSNRHVCTRNLARVHLDIYSFKLEEVARHLGVRKGPQQHRALGDALLAAAVFHKLQERVTASGAGSTRRAANVISTTTSGRAR